MWLLDAFYRRSGQVRSIVFLMFGVLVRMSDNATAQVDKLGLAHIIFGVVGPPCANDKVPFAIGGQNMIDGWKERKTGFVGGPA